MSIFGNNKKEQKDEEEQKDEGQSGNCSINILTLCTNDDSYLTLENLTQKQLKKLIAELKNAMNSNAVVDLSEYGVSCTISGRYLVSFNYEEEEDG